MDTAAPAIDIAEPGTESTAHVNGYHTPTTHLPRDLQAVLAIYELSRLFWGEDLCQAIILCENQNQ